MDLRTYPVMVFLALSGAAFAQVSQMGIVVDGYTITWNNPSGSKIINIDSPAGYHLSGSMKFDGSLLSYALILNGGPATEGNINMWYKAPASWFDTINYWGNTAAALFYGTQLGIVEGNTTLGTAYNNGKMLGDGWKFTNLPGESSSFEQHFPFTKEPPKYTYSINLSVTKPTGLTIDTRGWAGIGIVPEPSSIAAVTIGLGLMIRRRVKQQG
jgi:hypothetical protein